MYVVFADTIYRSMIYKKCNKLVQSYMSCRYSVISKLTVFNFINHIFHFLLRRIVTHSSHQVRKLVNWNLFIVKLSSFCCIFFLSPNYAVIKEIIHILECLSFSTTFNQIYKRLDSFTTNCDGLFNWSNIDVPHVYSKIFTATCKYVLSVCCTANVSHVIWMCDQSHSFVWIAI